MNKAKISFNTPSNTHGGVLTKLWQNIIRDNNLKPNLYNLVDRYLRNNSEIDNKNTVRKTKATLISNITASDMTWRTFIKLMFEYLGVRKIDITIKLTSASGSETLHSMTVKNSSFKDMKNDK